MGDDARNEAASAWWNAAKAYKQGYPECELTCDSSHQILIATLLLVAVDALAHTITQFCATGKFRQAADREKEIAQVCSVPRPFYVSWIYNSGL